MHSAHPGQMQCCAVDPRMHAEIIDAQADASRGVARCKPWLDCL
jgi:hypothetical protein